MKFLQFIFIYGNFLHVNCGLVFKRGADVKPSTEDYQKCFDKGDFLPIYNETASSFSCYLLSSQGPCKEGEWFLLNPENIEEQLCLENKCKGEKVFYKDECVQRGSLNDCPDGMEVYPDAFGNVECQCKINFVAIEGHQGCFQINTSGPCPLGEQVAENDEGGFCMNTGCGYDQLRWTDETCRYPPERKCEKDEMVALFVNLDVLDCWKKEESDGDENVLSFQSVQNLPSNCDEKSFRDSDYECKEKSIPNSTVSKAQPNRKHIKVLTCRFIPKTCPKGR